MNPIHLLARAAAIATLAAMAAIGCGGEPSSTTTGQGGSTGSATSSGAGGMSSSGSGGASSASSSGDTSSASGSGGSSNACPAPDQVHAGSFCIDRTEVSAASYAMFVAVAVPGTDPNQPASCAWNTSYAPGIMANGPDHPVVGVDWCDAYAYCAWAGKRLCGKIGAGPNPFDALADAASSQWYAACSQGGSRAFPYGDVYDPLACNGGDDLNPGTAPVGGTPGCEGGYPGIFDMSGNAWEWEDSCAADMGPTDTCRARGGGHGNGDMFHRCDYGGFFPQRDFAVGPVGIRCCSP